MPEIRRDYLTNNKVIISQIRANRPKGTIKLDNGNSDVKCPFCPDSEVKLSPAKLIYLKNEDGSISKKIETEDNYQSNWLVKVIPNLYPIFNQEINEEQENQETTCLERAYGIHEVVIDTPDHNNHFHLMNSEALINLFNVYKERFNELSKMPKIEYISITKNHGPNSGGTILHPHSQIIASEYIPDLILEELSKAESQETCIFEEIMAKEKKSLRYILENDVAFAICPYASIVPYEVRVFPKKHVNNVSKLENLELEMFALTIRDITRSIDNILQSPSYNIIFNQTIKQEKYHMYVRILPRFYHETGFEINLGLPVNEVQPEEAARELRKAFGS